MKQRLLVFLFLLLTAGGLQAQIQRDYLQRYTDGIQDSIFTALDVIELQDGGVALLARITQPGEGDFSPAIYRFDESGSLVDSIILDREGTLFSGQFSQATDGTFWVAVQNVNVSSGIENTRLLHITGDLETVVKDETVFRGRQPAGSAQFELRLGNLPPGTYFVRLDVSGGYMMQTVIKQ